MGRYDVAVLGAGPGGYEAAIRCAQYGLKTALIEARELGGTCLNRGCIPTKALLQGAHVFSVVKDARIYGVTTGAVSIEYSTLITFKEQIVGKLVKGIEGLEQAYGVEVYQGVGALEDIHSIRVGNNIVEAEKIILAVGSKPADFPISGSDQEWVINSDQVLSSDQLPKSVVIVGGGVIGIEFATIFAELGVQVTVLEMMNRILLGVDAQIIRQLERSLKRKNVKILTGASVQAFGNHTVRFEQKGKVQELLVEQCIICTGRKPCTEGIGLEKVGISTNCGFIEVDASMQTNIPGIYAIGDITGKIQLAHVATEQGAVAAANCAGKKKQMCYDFVPACIYTSPEIAYVGLSEEGAKEKGYEVITGVFQVIANGKSMIMNVQTGGAKIIADAATGRILGAQLMAPNATDMISEISVGMHYNMTVDELIDVIHPHPTVNEIVLQAALDVYGLCCNTAPKNKVDRR